MAAVAINLIPTETIRLSRLEKAALFANKAVIALLVIYALVLLGILSLLVVFTFQKNSLANQRANLRSQVESARQTETRLVALKDRLKLLSGVFSKKDSEFTSLLSDILSIKPEGVSITEVVAERGKLAISIIAFDSFVLEEFLDNLEKSGNFERVKIVTLARTPLGYSLTLDLVIAR